MSHSWLIERERNFLFGLVKTYRDNVVQLVSTVGAELRRFGQELVNGSLYLPVRMHRMLQDHHSGLLRIASALEEGLSVYKHDSRVESDDSFTQEHDSRGESNDSFTNVVLPDLPNSRSQHWPVSSDKSYDSIELENAPERHSPPAPERAELELINSVSDLGSMMMDDLSASMKQRVDWIVDLYRNHDCRRALGSMQEMDDIVRRMVLVLQPSSK